MYRARPGVETEQESGKKKYYREYYQRNRERMNEQKRLARLNSQETLHPAILNYIPDFGRIDRRGLRAKLHAVLNGEFDQCIAFHGSTCDSLSIAFNALMEDEGNRPEEWRLRNDKVHCEICRGKKLKNVCFECYGVVNKELMELSCQDDSPHICKALEDKKCGGCENSLAEFCSDCRIMNGESECLGCGEKEGEFCSDCRNVEQEVELQSPMGNYLVFFNNKSYSISIPNANQLVVWLEKYEVRGDSPMSVG